MVEEKLDVSFIHKDIGGTGDAVVYEVSDKILEVVDLKYGAGIIVEPEWNSQLMIYGLGALHAVWMLQTVKTRKAMSALNMIETVVVILFGVSLTVSLFILILSVGIFVSIIERMVEARLVPVSASATGNTFILFNNF